MNEMPNPVVPRIVWASLVATQVMLIAIPGSEAPTGAPPVLMTALAAVAVLEGVAAFLAFRMAVIGRIRSGALDVSTPEAAARANAALIVCWSLAASVGIYGFVLRVLGASYGDTLAFVIGGFALMGLMHPWHAELTPRPGGGCPTPIE